MHVKRMRGIGFLTAAGHEGVEMAQDSSAAVGEAAAARQPEGMGGLAKRLAILEAFDAQRPQLTVAEAARASGATPAAARRCLLTLQELGYVSWDGKFFRPTPRMVRLAGAYGSTATLPQLAQPILESTRETLAESVSLSVLDGDDVLYIARAEVPRIVTAGVRLGTALPAYRSSSGRMLLSGLSPQQLEAYLERLATHIGYEEAARTRARVEAARRDDVDYTDGGIEPGVLSLAVPVRDGAGTMVAALASSTLAARRSLAELEAEFLPALQRAAASLGRAL
jgi:IclR family pca regulon transcriptional regulator